MKIPEPLERLVEELSKLPGIGRKTAQRLAFSILRYSSQEANNLAQSIIEVKARIHFCPVCFGFTEKDPCDICQNTERQRQIICVVEQPNNIFPIEKSGIFRGVYHVLMGAISPLDGIGPNQLKIKELEKRIDQEEIEEVILGTNPTVQGEATALYLQQKFCEKVGKITRLSRGLPAGGDLEYVDDITMIEAFSGRRSL